MIRVARRSRRSEEKRAAVLAAGGVPVGIGENCVIENAIIDKNARVGKNCVITNAAGVEDFAARRTPVPS